MIALRPSCYPVNVKNQSLRHTRKCLAAMAVCVCQLRAVLHYSLRTESRTESNWLGLGRNGHPSPQGWHTQNGPKVRVARGNATKDKANREQLALKSGGGFVIVSKTPLEPHSQTRGDRGNRAHGLATDSIPHSATEPPAYPSKDPWSSSALRCPAARRRYCRSVDDPGGAFPGIRSSLHG